MERKSIVAEICDQADDFLEGVAKREEAKAGIAEWLTIHCPALSPEEKQTVIKEALRILEDEEFFAADAGAVNEDTGGLSITEE